MVSVKFEIIFFESNEQSIKRETPRENEEEEEHVLPGWGCAVVNNPVCVDLRVESLKFFVFDSAMIREIIN